MVTEFISLHLAGGEGSRVWTPQRAPGCWPTPGHRSSALVAAPAVPPGDTLQPRRRVTAPPGTDGPTMFQLSFQGVLCVKGTGMAQSVPILATATALGKPQLQPASPGHRGHTAYRGDDQTQDHSRWVETDVCLIPGNTGSQVK